MNFNPRKLFIIVGHPHSGKKRTIQHLFQRKQFYAYKQPIKLDALWQEKFIVIHSPPPYVEMEEHLLRIKAVIQHHAVSDTSFILSIPLVFDDGIRDVKKIFQYFNQSAFEIYYMVLSCSWFDKQVMSPAMISQLEQQIKNGNIHLFDRLVTRSELRFGERVAEVKEFIRGVFDRVV